MKNVGYGCRDTGEPCLFFDVYISDNTAALQVLTSTHAYQAIRESGVYDVRELEGKPCWVDVNGAFISFLRLANIK